MVGRRQIGKYSLGRAIGRGGLGLVYRAEDQESGLVVALKILPADKVEPLTGYRPETLRLWESIQHPHIAKVRDIGVYDDVAYIATDFVEGVDSSRLIQDGPLPPDEAFKYVADIADALAALHRVGLVHRDVKPSNIIVTGSGDSVLIDLGMASETSDVQSSDDGPAIFGTPLYMAPELFSGDGRPNSQTDVYSLACVLFEYLTGKPAFDGSSMPDIIRQKFYQLPRLPPGIVREFPGVEAVLRRSLSPVVVARTGSAGEFERQLQQVYDGSRLRPPHEISSAAVSTSLPLRSLADTAGDRGVPDQDVAGALRSLPAFGLRDRVRTAAAGLTGRPALPVGVAAMLTFTAAALNGSAIAAVALAVVPLLAHVILAGVLEGRRRRAAQALSQNLGLMVSRATDDFWRMRVSLTSDFASYRRQEVSDPTRRTGSEP